MLDKSLEQIENDFWGPPAFPSHLVTTCHKIRTIPLKHLTEEHLRMMIGQKFSLSILMPIAIEKLWNDPLLEANFFEGDLLKSVLLCDDYFRANEEAKIKALEFCNMALIQIERGARKSIDSELIHQIQNFVSLNP